MKILQIAQYASAITGIVAAGSLGWAKEDHRRSDPRVPAKRRAKLADLLCQRHVLFGLRW